MATNVSSSFNATIRRQISRKVLPLTQRFLIAYQFADKKKMAKGEGVTWTANRFNRMPLPAAPLSEGVPPTGQNLTFSQVTGVALQWGDKCTITDVLMTTTPMDLIEQAKEKLAIAVAELHERNTFSVLMGGTQVNYVNSRGARASILAGDVLDTTTINRTYSNMANLGAPFYNGSMEPNPKRSIETGPKNSEKSPYSGAHYVAIVNTLVENDLRQNSTLVQAWSYSDITRLYINEVGYYAGIHFTQSNMTPKYTGVAQVNGGAAGAAGSLASNTYYLVVTGSDSLNQIGETLIYQVSAGVVNGNAGTGSIPITVPSTAGYTYSVYIGTTTSPVNLAGSTSTGIGIPTVGVYSGMATNIAPGSAVVLTSVGLYQVPPAAPATGVTVFPTFVFGQQYFAITQLEDISWTSLFEADKSDPLNQLRIVGYKFFEGAVILNQQFGCRIESSASNTGTFG